ncbi:hypothetical protein RhiirC2_780868 [Rhizophagus irregularis]|uniref:Uncharacterized protein n=1 Tax=Rhizophagus irregularis TaxID=588596 RepID=A0A2N1N6P9_9GLOM|nr:hypothetical protein RhiirC2_780868 [Rhizophagus irregularis]
MVKYSGKIFANWSCELSKFLNRQINQLTDQTSQLWFVSASFELICISFDFSLDLVSASTFHFKQVSASTLHSGSVSVSTIHSGVWIGISFDYSI